METLQQFLAMGGYAAFVWPSFAVVALGMLGLLIASMRAWRQSERILAVLQADRRAARDGDASGAGAGDA